MSEALNPMTAGQESGTAPIAQAVETNSALPTEQVQQASDQPLTFANRAEFDKAVDERLAAIKQDWLNESYQNSQSMNDKFAAAVNAKLNQLQQLGIKADQVQAAKLVKAEQEAQQRQQQSAQRQGAVDPGYQEFLGRFGVRNGNDVRLRDAYGLETEYGIKLEKGDVEYQKYFADPKKEYSVFGFGRAYERALNEKKLRLGSEKTEPAQGANPAALPFLSGSGARSNIVENKTPSSNLLAQGAEEMRQRFSKNW